MKELDIDGPSDVQEIIVNGLQNYESELSLKRVDVIDYSPSETPDGRIDFDRAYSITFESDDKKELREFARKALGKNNRTDGVEMTQSHEWIVSFGRIYIYEKTQ